MKYFSITLSSYQLPIQKPDCINGYLFVDPIYSTFFTYLCTVDNGAYSVPLATPPQISNLYIESFNPYCYYGNLSVNDISNYLQKGRAEIVSNDSKFFNLCATRLSKIRFIDNNNFDFNTGSFTLVSVFSGHTAQPNTNPRRIISHGHWALNPGYLLQVSKTGKAYSGIGSTNVYGPGCNCVYFETSGAPLKRTGFNHVVATFNTSTNIANLYVNGVKQYLRPAAVLPLTYLLNVSGIDLDISGAAANSNASSTSPFQIGGAPEDLNTDGNTSEHFTGDIAVTKLFNYAFTQQQVNNDIQTYYYLLTTTTFNFTSTANGGLFFPWGYPIQRRSYNSFLGDFKGDLTLTINPSGIDDYYFKLLKLIYSDGIDKTLVIDKDIVPTYTYSGENIVRIGANFADPKSYAIKFLYRPSATDPTSYTSSVTAILGNFDVNIYNITFNLYKESIYNINNVHLVNTVDYELGKSNTVLELVDPYQLVSFSLLSSTPDHQS